MELQGIIPPMITPLKSGNELDARGTERLIEHILNGGVHGLFILGTTGEGTNLSYKLRRELIQTAAGQVDGRVPLLAGITDTSLTESIRLADFAAEFGADAVVAAPPYYFSSNQQELVTYYEKLADAISIPLYLYNMPSHTKVHFEPQTVHTLAGHPNIIGFKDSSGDAIYFQKITKLLKNYPGFSILVGPEEILMHTVLSGGHGGVCGGANLFPALYVAMYNAVIERNFEKMNRLQQAILGISLNIYTIGSSPARYLQGVKCALSVMGICKGELAPPYTSLKGAERSKVVKYLDTIQMEKILE